MSDAPQPPRPDPGPPADRTPTTPPADATTPTSPDEPTAHVGHRPVAPGKGAALGRVVRHRATQLVAVGLLGLVLGGAVVAVVDRDHRPRHGAGADRPGHSKFDERPGGRFDGRFDGKPDKRFDERFQDRGERER